MRANSVQREPQIQKFWQDNKVYESCLQDETKVGTILYAQFKIMQLHGK